MSVFLDILRCVLCCVEDEDENEVLYRDTLLQTRMNSSNQLFNIEEAYAKFVSIFHSNRTENVSVVPSYNPPAFYSRLPKSSSIPSPSRPKPQTTPSPGAEPFPVHHIPSRKSLNPPPSTPKPPTYVSKPSPSFPTSVSSSSSSSKQTPVSPAVLVPKATISFPPPVSSSSKPTLVSPIVPPSFKPVLAPVSANSTDQQNTSIYILDEKDKSPIYAIPKDIKDLIKKDKVPDVLKKPLTLSTYKDYFTALLYAEDFYIEGVLYRIERSTNVLVEFGGDFHSQHLSSRKYDVSFSLNRVCLKRAHQAILAASDPSFGSFTFPDCKFWKQIDTLLPPYSNYKLDMNQISAVCRILTHQRPPPYLIEGPLCIPKGRLKDSPLKSLSVTGEVVQQAVLEIYQTSKTNRVLICAPINNTCDDLMRSLKEIPESEVFRANAAFREIYEVSPDILVSSLYKENCFACPPLEKLKKFRVILSTYASSFRLHNVGINSGHFSHIFMVDASSATEPEVMVALANLANENTAVVVTGAPRNRSGWVRSNLARENGLMISYFERLRQRNPYKSLDPNFITRLVSSDSKLVNTASLRPSLA